MQCLLRLPHAKARVSVINFNIEKLQHLHSMQNLSITRS